MKKLKHISAQASHYNKEADTYDLFNEKNSLSMNQAIYKILKNHNAKSVLDLTCGTGSQVFFLDQKGFEICGYDINTKMLSIAKKKTKEKNKKLVFKKGDMRTTQAGQYDAVLTMFNAIGHLTQSDFKKTIKNIHSNLNDKGLYIFDIFNLDYLLYQDNITKLTIDWLKKNKDKTVREIQYSTIDYNGVLSSYDIYQEQVANKPMKLSTAEQTLQVYRASQLKELLKNNGFKVLKQSEVNGDKFYKNKSQRILTVAQKS